MKLLLEDGADVNAHNDMVNVDSKDQSGRTPLRWAAQNGHEAVVKLLLNTSKVDIDFTDQNGEDSPYLGIWRNAWESDGYGSVRKFVNEITAEDRVSFDSITWEWDLPAVLASDVESDIVLMCQTPRTELVNEFGYNHSVT